MNAIWSPLRSSVRILRFFFPQEQMPVSPHPLIPALHRNTHDSSALNLSDWATSVLASHQCPQAVLDWQIVSVQWYKNKSGLEYEYSVFTLKKQSSPDCIFLRFDRRLSAEALDAKREDIVVKPDVFSVVTPQQQKKVTDAVTQEMQSLLKKHLQGIVRAWQTASEKDVPEDTIVRSMHSNGIDTRDSDKADLLITYSNFSRPFPLRDLAIIAKAVVASSDRYSLFAQQCYWFTRTIVGISVAIYDPRPVGGIENGGLGRSGRINRLPFLPVINEDNPAEIALLVGRVNHAIGEDDRQVQARYMDGAGGKIAAEAKIRELEARLDALSRTGCPSL